MLHQLCCMHTQQRMDHNQWLHKQGQGLRPMCAAVSLPCADAATASGSINKVILASSIVSVMWDWWERGSDYTYSGAAAWIRLS